MRIISIEEKQEMHNMLDLCISKLEDTKNNVKPHWNELSQREIQMMIDIECKELSLALYSGKQEDIATELKDIINLGIFGMHNLFT